LVERGALSLDAPVRSLLPDIPYDSRLLVRHLLSQTSGVPNPIPLRWVHLPAEHDRFEERARLAAILAEHRELDFAPGDKYRYSNLSYWLLGRLVEQVTGARFAEHLAESVFRPLDLPPEEIAFTIPASERHAQGYLPRLSFMNLFKRFLVDEPFIGERQGPWTHVNDAYVDGPAYGGLVTSARALARLLQDLLTDDSHLLGPRGRQLLFERQRDADGDPVEMTLGWHVGEEHGVPYYFKEGGGAGFHGEMRLYPAANIASVVIANNAAFDVKGFLRDLDGEFLRSVGSAQ
jgi:D-alanyl-D-alanine carboxypeptidase